MDNLQAQCPHVQPQQAPVHHEGAECVQDLVIEDLSGRGHALGLCSIVAFDVLARKQQGLRKYNSVLEPNNGRRVLVDLYQEVLDALQYARQGMEEFVARATDGRVLGDHLQSPKYLRVRALYQELRVDCLWLKDMLIIEDAEMAAS